MADRQDAACLAVLDLGAEKAKPEQRLVFEAGAFSFIGKIRGRHPRSDLLDDFKAAAPGASTTDGKRCAGEMRASEGLLGTIVPAIPSE